MNEIKYIIFLKKGTTAPIEAGMIISFNGKRPDLGGGVFIAENSTVIGNVSIGDQSSIWFGAVVRGDDNSIRIGKRTNVQDLCVIHVDSDHGTVIGDDCVVGHRAIIHGAQIGDRCLIGMGAIIMNSAKIGNDCIVGAGALVTEGAVIPPRSLVMGFPARVKRGLTDDEVRMIISSAKGYADRAAGYMASISS